MTTPKPLKIARVALRVSEAAKAQWQEAADGDGLELAAWMRQMLGRCIVQRDGRWITRQANHSESLGNPL